MADKVIVATVLGGICLMVVTVLGLSQIEGTWQERESPWGREPDWSRPVYIIQDATLCPARSGAEWAFNHPNQRVDCFHMAQREAVIATLGREPPWVYVRLASGQPGWTWWGQLAN